MARVKKDKSAIKITPAGLYKIECDNYLVYFVGKIEYDGSDLIIIDNEDGDHDECSSVVLTIEEWEELRDFIDSVVLKEK